MEIKKSEKANLENKKLMFKEIGLLLALLLTLGAFEWSTSEANVNTLDADQKVIVDDDNVPITNDTPPPPPENVAEPVLSDAIDIVDDNIKVDNNLLTNTEDDKNLGVEIKKYIVQPTHEEEEVDDAVPFAIVEEKPKFKGGDQNEFTKWVYANLVYPEIAKENGVQGKVTLQFYVNADGGVSDVSVLRGIDSSIDKEAIRVISSSPKWTPGRQRNKNVKVKYVFTITFQLR